MYVQHRRSKMSGEKPLTLEATQEVPDSEETVAQKVTDNVKMSLLAEWERRGLIDRSLRVRLEQETVNLPDLTDSVVQAIASRGKTAKENKVSQQPLESLNRLLPEDWSKFTKYAFWVATMCIVISIGFLLGSFRSFLEGKLGQHTLEIVEAVFKIVMAFGFFYVGLRRRKTYPEKYYSNESLLFAGVYLTWVSVNSVMHYYRISSGSVHLALVAIFVTMGFAFESNLIWLASLVEIAFWHWDSSIQEQKYSTINSQSLRTQLVVFMGIGLSLAILGLAVLPRHNTLKFHAHTTSVMGLLYFFSALLVLSLGIRQPSAIMWFLVLTVAWVACVYHGVRFKNNVTKGFGLVFMFLQLYSKYFELCFGSFPLGLFFLLLGLSFWLIGSHFESIWNLERVLETRSHMPIPVVVVASEGKNARVEEEENHLLA